MAANRVTDLPLGNARDAIAVVPADADIAEFSPRQLFITTGGSLVVITARGTTRTLTVPNGFTFQCQVRQVKAATTCTGIIGYE